jgi:ribosomal protein L21E
MAQRPQRKVKSSSLDARQPERQFPGKIGSVAGERGAEYRGDKLGTLIDAHF